MAARIYLDNAATSWPKPNSVYEAVDQYQRENGASAGRSTYRHATEARQLVERARVQLGHLLNAPHGSQILFAFNGTDALNLCLHGLLEEGDHVVTSDLEHNSVLRPLRSLQLGKQIGVAYARSDDAGVVSAESVRAQLQPSTRLVVLTHASNVTGVIQPVAEIAEVAHDAGALLLVDAAQALGHFPLDVDLLGVDMLAASGHKGLLGPLGTGLVYLREGLADQLKPLRQGGTGSRSDEIEQPLQLPDRFEAGNLNVPGLAGLAAGVAVVRDRESEVRQHEVTLISQLVEGCRSIPGLSLASPPTSQPRVGVVSLVSQNYHVHDLAAMLDTHGGIQLRAGLHCAPLIHDRLGTRSTGGTLRASVGPFNTSEQIDALLALLRDFHP